MSAAGDIWSSGALAFESPLKDLLDSGSYTLEDLLAEDELLQELRAAHPQLVTFFSTEDSATGLVRYLLSTPNTTSSPHSMNNKDCPSDEIDASVGLQHCIDGENTSASEMTDKCVSDGLVSKQTNWLLQNTTEPTSSSDSGEDANKTQVAKHDEYNKIYIRFPYIACEVI